MKIVRDTSQNNKYSVEKIEYEYSDDFKNPESTEEDQAGDVKEDVLSDVTEVSPLPSERLKKTHTRASEKNCNSSSVRQKDNLDIQSEIFLRNNSARKKCNPRVRPPWQDPNATIIPTDNVVYFKNLLEAFGKPIFHRPARFENFSCNRPYHSGLNRRRQLEKIQIENYAMADRIKNAKTTPHLRRDVQLRDYKLYFNANWTPQTTVRQSAKKKRPSSAMPYFDRESLAQQSTSKGKASQGTAESNSNLYYNESNNNNVNVSLKSYGSTRSLNMYSSGPLNTSPVHSKDLLMYSSQNLKKKKARNCISAKPPRDKTRAWRD